MAADLTRRLKLIRPEQAPQTIIPQTPYKQNLKMEPDVVTLTHNFKQLTKLNKWVEQDESNKISDITQMHQKAKWQM